MCVCPARVWIIQLAAWTAIVLLSKAILAVVLFELSKPVSAFGCWLMSPIADRPKLELVVVMVLGPYVLNACQFWVRCESSGHTCRSGFA